MKNLTEINYDIIINKDFLDLIIINLYNCFYSAIEINNNCLYISNSKEKEKAKLINPFPEDNIDKDKIQNLLIYLLSEYIKQKIFRIKDLENKSQKDTKILTLLEIIYNGNIDFDLKTPNDLIVIYLKNLINIIYCKDINQFQTIIYNYRHNELEGKKKKIYYRGNKLNHDLSTSLYRDKRYPRIEHIINNRCIQSMPNDFDGCETFFDKLTILKHFNCPSRLLDITGNPLVASFFALDNYESNEQAKYGSINLCFSSNKNIIKNSQNSDSVSLISALCTTRKEIPTYSSIIEPLTTYLKKLYTNELEDAMSLKSKIDSDYFFYDFWNIKKLIKTSLTVIDESLSQQTYTLLSLYLKKIELFEKFKDDEKEFARLFKNFSDETATLNSTLINDIYIKKYFFEGELQHQAALIDTSFNLYLPQKKDINTYYIVHPSLNNERIRNQQGLFILVGANLNNDNYYLQANMKYLDLFKDNNMRTVIIINNYNNDFYNELANSYGINKGFIYPEIEKKITQIKDEVILEYDI